MCVNDPRSTIAPGDAAKQSISKLRTMCNADAVMTAISKGKGSEGKRRLLSVHMKRPNEENQPPSMNPYLLSFGAMLIALAYIALAAWGWGGFGRLLANPARASVCAALATLAAITPLCGCNVSPGRQADRGNDWIFAALVLAGLAMGYISAYCDRRNLWTIDGNAARYGGLAMFLCGFSLRVAAMLALGRRFSVWVAVQEGHRLQTTGLYRFVRHPSYTGAMLTLLGWALTFRSIIGLALAALMLLPLASRMAAEERILVLAFGTEYSDYQQKSWRLLPGIY